MLVKLKTLSIRRSNSENLRSKKKSNLCLSIIPTNRCPINQPTETTISRRQQISRYGMHFGKEGNYIKLFFFFSHYLGVTLIPHGRICNTWLPSSPPWTCTVVKVQLSSDNRDSGARESRLMMVIFFRININMQLVCLPKFIPKQIAPNNQDSPVPESRLPEFHCATY